MTYPSFVAGEVLRATDVNAIGCWLVKSQTVGIGVASVEVTGAFSADYDSYFIVWEGGTASTGALITMQLGASAASYNNVLVYGSSYATPTVTGGASNNASAWNFMGWADTNFAHLDVRLFGPFLAKYTGCAMTYMADSNAGSGGGIHKVATSYTSFKLIPNAGTLIGGVISVYGYKK
jgi:hypothetical protein